MEMLISKHLNIFHLPLPEGHHVPLLFLCNLYFHTSIYLPCISFSKDNTDVNHS